MMITGTNHFTGFKAAVAYYTPYGLTERDVEAKIKKGEISIRSIPKGKTSVREGRYFIHG